MSDDLPIIPHELLGVDCCGCLIVRQRGEHADIVCNECGSVVRTVPLAEVAATIRELGETDSVCTVRCPHCGALSTFPGWRDVEAFICRECGRAAVFTPGLQ